MRRHFLHNIFRMCDHLRNLTSPSTVKIESAFWGSKCFIRRLLRWFSTRSWTWAGSTPAVKIKKWHINEWQSLTKKVTIRGWRWSYFPENSAGPCSLTPTHLDEPLCQQVDGLSHSRVVFREKRDDVFWRASGLEISEKNMISIVIISVGL